MLLQSQSRHLYPQHPASDSRAFNSATHALGWLALALFFFALFCAYWLTLYPPQSQAWPVVPADVVQTRVVEAGFDAGTLYRGEVLLHYSARGQSHSTWKDCGVMGRSSEAVQRMIPRWGYRVRYNPDNPAQARMEQ